MCAYLVDSKMAAILASGARDGGSRGSAYSDWTKIGEGTFGVVYRAKLTGEPPPIRSLAEAPSTSTSTSSSSASASATFPSSGAYASGLRQLLAMPPREPLIKNVSSVALKRIRGTDANRGVDFTTLREIKMLSEMDHANVIKLWECFEMNGSVVLALELCVTDLEEVVRNVQIDLTPAHIKSFMAQLLAATQYMHERWVLHRDLKPNNLLIDARGVLKVTDFGLARTFGDLEARMTPTSVTRWYRPPELLYGSRNYGGAVDVWSCGCIFAELVLRAPYLPGTNEIDQLERIFTMRGSATKDSWPNVSLLPLYMDFPDLPGTPFQKMANPRAQATSDEAVALMDSMLTFDPLRRPSAKTCLTTAYFATAPPLATLEEIAKLLPKAKDGAPGMG